MPSCSSPQPDDIDLLNVASSNLRFEPIDAPSNDPSQPWLDAFSQSTAQAIITSSDLPQPSKDRLLTHTYDSPDQVTSAIESERLYLAQLSQDSIIQIGDSPPRSPHISGLRSSVDQLSLALDALLAGTRPPDVQPLTDIVVNNLDNFGEIIPGFDLWTDTNNWASSAKLGDEIGLVFSVVILAYFLLAHSSFN
jgi:hypothetical protein